MKYVRNFQKKDPKNKHKYIYFTLFKSNIDTTQALFKLSKILGVSQKLFGSAGLKDKRGVTTQRISLYNTEPQVL